MAAERIPRLAVEARQASSKPTSRIDSIDLMRGVVMVVMMLDHTRDFLHSAAFQFDPTDLARTNVALFVTRWITHFCAPVFVFLAGTGAYLQFASGKSKSELSKFLLTRGLWLVVLEFTVVRLGAFFSLDYRLLGILQVIWAIGISMIILALLVHLPLKAVGGFGLAMIALHNLFDSFQVQPWLGQGSPVPPVRAKLWMLLHQPGAFPIADFPSPIVIVIYPLIPWIGVMAAGYSFGALYRMTAQQRRRLLLITGGVATALFILLRYINMYGDPSIWSPQKNALFTVLSFLNTTKYPPSLLFLLMTLGPTIAALAWFETRKGAAPTLRPHKLLGRLRNALITYGRVPLFFYLLQWPTVHLISIILHALAGKPVRWLFVSPLDLFITGPPPGIGFNLAVVYAAWIAGVLLLYPVCKWFAGVKQRRRNWWLSYL